MNLQPVQPQPIPVAPSAPPVNLPPVNLPPVPPPNMVVVAPNLDPLVHAMTALVTTMQAQQAAGHPPRESNVTKIDPFYGNEQDPISWLEEFEKVYTANNYTDARKLQVVQAHLKSTATTWLYR